jgi:hypothetical protein
MHGNQNEFDKLYGSKFFGVGDLNGARKRVVEIEELREQDGSKRQKYVVYFIGEDKPLVLNKTNAQTLAHALSKDRQDWVGATVELYSEMTGLGKLGVRLRPMRGGPTAPTRSNPPVESDPPQWEPDPDDFR